MAAINFPAAPAPGDTHTENGATYTWNGSAWVVGASQIPPVPPIIQIKRTPTDNNPPAALLPGELGIEMGTPLRLWVGVPALLDPSEKKLVAFMGAGDPYVDITGDTMTGDLAIMKDAPKLTLNRLTVAGGAAEVIGMLAGVRRWTEQFGNATAEAGANVGSDYILQGYTDAGAALAAPILRGKRATNRLEVAGPPIDPLDIATKAYVDSGGVTLIPMFEASMAYSGLQINGNMEISQENGTTSVAIPAVSTKYSCDVWLVNWGMLAGVTATTAQMPPPGNCPGLPYSLRLTSAAGSATPVGEYAIIQQHYEGTRWNKLQWGSGASAKPITISFWVFTDGVGPYPLTGTVSVRNVAGNRSYRAEFQVTAAAGWQFKTVTIPGCTDGVWNVENSLNAANLNFGFAGGPSVQGPPNAWTATSAFISSNQSNFFGGVNHSVYITGVTVLPGTQIPTLANYPFVTRRHDQEFPNVQRWVRKHVWTMEGYCTGASQRFQAGHEIPAMRVAGATIRQSIGSSTNIRAADPALYVFANMSGDSSVNQGMEGAAAGYIAAVSVNDILHNRF